MDAYGNCFLCHGEGALWRYYKPSRKYIFFGPLVLREFYICDECDGKKQVKARLGLLAELT